MRDDTALFPEMPDTAHGKLVEGTQSKPPSPLPWGGGRQEELEEEPELPSYYDEH
jgi:hypothetical protein